MHSNLQMCVWLCMCNCICHLEKQLCIYAHHRTCRDGTMCIVFIFFTVAMNWKIVNNNAHSNIYADAPQMTLDVQCPQHFDRNNDGASLTTKAWSRLLHFDLLVKIFAFTPRYCVNQVTCLLHACCWVITVCLKTFNLFEVFFATFGATKSIKCRSWRGVTTIRQTRQWSAKIVNLYFGQQQPRRVNNILKTIFCPFDVDFICYASWSRVWPICHSLACFTKSSKGCS